MGGRLVVVLVVVLLDVDVVEQVVKKDPDVEVVSEANEPKKS